MEITARERLLKNVRNAIISKSSAPYENLDYEKPIYVKHQSPYPDVIFAEEFNKLGGKFVYCEDENELVSNIGYLFEAYKYNLAYCADNEIKEILTIARVPFGDDSESLLTSGVAITYCECLVARFGSVMISSRQVSGRKGVIYPPVHIVLAFASQIVMEIKDAVNYVRNKYNNKLPSMVSLLTGPSRTADIEKTLVMGAHGPKELYVFLIEDRKK